MATNKKKNPPFVRTENIPLADNHGWRATEGHKVLVIGRGDLRFEYPKDWVHEITEQSIKMRDKPFPKDVMLLEVSVLRTPPAPRWGRVPALNVLLSDNLRKAGHLVMPDQIHVRTEPGLDLAWAEYSQMEEDPQTKLQRMATWRQANCNAGPYHLGKHMPFGIMTFGFWSEFRDRADPVWEHILRSIVMGHEITDASKGPQYN